MKYILLSVWSLFMACTPTYTGDYGVVVEYYAANRVYEVGVSADNAGFVSVSSGDKNSVFNQFKIVEPAHPLITPISPTLQYNFPYNDEYVRYVEYGAEDESSKRFYVQGFKGALFEECNLDSIMW